MAARVNGPMSPSIPSRFGPVAPKFAPAALSSACNCLIRPTLPPSAACGCGTGSGRSAAPPATN